MNACDELARQLTQGIAAHSFWATHLRVAIDQCQSSHSPEAVREATCCTFGRWLDKRAAELCRFPQFSEARELHVRFHAATSEVLELALAGRREQALARLAEGSAFNETARDLTRAMISWRRSVSVSV